MDKSQRETLIVAASDARDRAYADYSGFCVGAALLAAGGRVFTGCNVENAVYGLTICAERVAVVSAVASGERQFQAIAVASSGGAAPCGSCRQFLAEFCDDLPILLVDVDSKDRVKEETLRDLLPARFRLPP